VSGIRAGHCTARRPLRRRSSGLSALIKDRLSGGASRLAALLLPQILPVSSVVAPCDPGAARRHPVLVQRGQATWSNPHASVTARRSVIDWGNLGNILARMSLFTGTTSSREDEGPLCGRVFRPSSRLPRMGDDAFYAPGRVPPTPRVVPRPAEPLWELHERESMTPARASCGTTASGASKPRSSMMAISV
jgi:hypothetical protein